MLGPHFASGSYSSPAKIYKITDVFQITPGAGFKILHNFHVQAVHSIIEFLEFTLSFGTFRVSPTRDDPE